LYAAVDTAAAHSAGKSDMNKLAATIAKHLFFRRLSAEHLKIVAGCAVQNPVLPLASSCTIRRMSQA
jgi:hypothetical protein